MWFADIGLGVAWAVLAGWVLAVTLAATVGCAAGTSVLVRPSRLPVLAGTGAAAALFVAQAGVVDTVEDLTGTGPLDQSVWAWFVGHRVPAVTVAMTAVSAVGGTAGMAVLALLGAVLLWRARRRVEAEVVIGAAVGAGLLVEGFKRLYGRPRPPRVDQLTVETSASLPSGHALGSVVVLGVLATAVVLAVRRPAVRAGTLALATVAILTIGASRLYLGVHWVTDVLTGWLLGGTWLAVCVTALVLVGGGRARSTDHPSPPPTRTRGA